MDFGTQDCDFDQYLSCYTFFKSESPLVSVDSCSQHLVQCPLHKSSNGVQVLPGQYHHQDHQSSHHSLHPFPSIIQPIPSLLASPIIPTCVDQSFSSKFTCTLVAQTLPAVKLTEEPVTCLNQGQSYDIKLKKHGDTNPAKYYKSNIRLMFHHRRLQHSEQEQFQHWLRTRPDQRLIELDLPLAYNVLNSTEDPRTPNMISISWMGQSEASISVKINCISTEFTAKKHGGEKGVPFRLQVDTYAVMDDEELNTHLLHRAFCLVKVFKPNGADRKNKNDSLKLSKVPSAERDMYHPSYEVTTFSEVQPQSSTFSPTEWINDEGLLRQDSKKPSSSSHQTPNYSVQNKAIGSPGSSFSPEQQNTPQENDKTWTDLWKTENRQPSAQPILTRSSSSLFTDSSPSPPSLRSTIFQDANNNFVTLRNQDKMASPHLTSESTTGDLRTWLKANNFEKWIPAFEHYSGAEIYMLSKEDFMKICGVAEGIRMFYKIYSGIGPSTKKSLYISHMAGTKRRLYMRKNLSSESLESPSSVSSTVTTGSCSNLLANNINDMTLEHQNQVKSHTVLNQTDSNNCVKKGAKRSHEGSETSRGHQENSNNCNNVDNNIPNCKKNKFSDDRDIELPVYSAIHLKWLTYAHLVEKLCETFHLSNQLVAQIYLVDRDGTDITVTDEIVERLKDHSIFTMDILTDGASRKKFILLIPLCQKD